MNSILSLIRSILPTSMQNLHDLAINHSPAILFFLYLFIGIFTLLSLISLFYIRKKSAVHTAMRFAPNIMTALGLLGTFWGLTSALNDFGIEQNQIQNFMRQLKGIFVFSLLGIGSALFFMAFNAIISGFQAITSRQLYQQRKDEETNYRNNAEENNRQVVGSLTQQTQLLTKQQDTDQQQTKFLEDIAKATKAQVDNIIEVHKNDITIKTEQQHLLNNLLTDSQSHYHSQTTSFEENNRLLNLLNEKQNQQVINQAAINNQLIQKFDELSQAIQKIETGYDETRLGQVIGKEIRNALEAPLNQIALSLQTNNSDIIRKLLEELKVEVLEPIKHEIATTNDSVIKVTQAVSDSNETNRRMIGALNATVTTMNEVTQKTQAVVTKMDGMIERMATLRTQQKEDLNQFNRDLQTNLNSIKPLISEGMKEAETALIEVINTASDNMNKTLTTTQGHIQTVADGMNDTVSTMGTIQKEQKVALDEFNSNLRDNLDTIKPAITDSMKVAEVALTGAIALAMKEMNSTLKDTQNAMSEIIGQMSKDVLTRIENVLNSFNTGMDAHLNRMNTELEQTGNRASNLMTQTANNLERSLGDIHKTIHDSSTVLQKELQEFREQYQLNLNDFFDKQNKALELTLGEQNKALQATANELNTQFTNMTSAQQDLLATQQALNNDLNRIKTEFDQVYSGLLIKMTTLADTLSKNENRYLKSLGDTNKEMQEINKALMDMGHQLPKEFATAFEKLNEAYKIRFNELNEKSHTFMSQIVAATGALIQTVTALKDQA
ncbi:hypothetical protein E6P72_07635 [Moraxella osloensis]|nr:MotA/TolQ/ExbB proton channel family protein [Moraxella osloensis]MDI4480954.1 hypothetical protein [Moraxella osloensis]